MTDVLFVSAQLELQPNNFVGDIQKKGLPVTLVKAKRCHCEKTQSRLAQHQPWFLLSFVNPKEEDWKKRGGGSKVFRRPKLLAYIHTHIQSLELGISKQLMKHFYFPIYTKCTKFSLLQNFA